MVVFAHAITTDNFSFSDAVKKQASKIFRLNALALASGKQQCHSQLITSYVVRRRLLQSMEIQIQTLRNQVSEEGVGSPHLCEQRASLHCVTLSARIVETCLLAVINISRLSKSTDVEGRDFPCLVVVVGCYLRLWSRVIVKFLYIYSIISI